MTKSLSASKKVMQTYLSELLTEEVEETVHMAKVKEKKAQPIEKLLNTISLPKVAENHPQALIVPPTIAREAKVESKLLQEVASKHSIENNRAANKVLMAKNSEEVATPIKKSYRQDDFQAMFFNVAGLLIAVPLIELGGIHNNHKTTSLMGKPDWFRGVMVYRDEKVNVVDTAKWVMPEKCTEELMASLNYQYVIMLNDSNWGLLAENLVDTVTLKQNDVKWLDSSNKRPWLAGLVKDRMCALLDVDSLISLLEKGLNITPE